jgi:ribosomal protein S18 acetylase RimI-like enzyme
MRPTLSLSSRRSRVRFSPGALSVQIRPATPNEADAVDELVQRAYVHYVDRIGGRPGPMDEDYRQKVAEAKVSVAVEADELLGLIVLAREPDHLLIENVAVEPDRQNQGIGRALLAFAEEVAVKASLRTLRLYTHALMTENLAFYPRLGYTEFDRRAENGFERIFFSKDLKP